MNKFFKIIAIIALVAVAATANAQKTTKIGHIDLNQVISLMPGQDTLAPNLEKHIKALQDELGVMQADLEAKATDYQKNLSTMSAIIKATKEKELTDLQDRIQTFQNNAQRDISEYQNKLITPFVDKAKQAVKDVAKEGGYTYIINGVPDILIYSEGGDDITALVKKKLGITK